MPCVESDCPHNSICCSWGVSVTDEERPQIIQAYGIDSVIWDEEEKEWRTAVKDGKCVFQKDNRCMLHDKPYYPYYCKIFPFDGYEYDVTICPFMAELEKGKQNE